jgi:hypothetical protein
MVERGEKGQLKKGSVLNPKGRPKKSREIRYHEITLNTCSFDDWQAIVAKAVEQAKRGDAVARKWLADYLVGVPETPLAGGVEILVRYVGKDD